jgi:hypothetical protein
VLKVVRLADATESRWPASPAEKDPWYWRREPIAYRSGLLDGLAPACLACVEREDGTVALWLEDVGTSTEEWSPERLGEAAFRLGLAQAPLCGRPADRAVALPRLAALVPAAATSADRRRRRGGPRAGGDEWTTLARLDAAPQTLCHHDFHPGNVLGELVIDWAYCGLGARARCGCAPRRLALRRVRPARPRYARRPQVWDGYLSGLREGGWSGAERGVRHAFLAGTALRYSWIPGRLGGELDPATRERWTATLPLLLDWVRQLPSAP